MNLIERRPQQGLRDEEEQLIRRLQRTWRHIIKEFDAFPTQSFSLKTIWFVLYRVYILDTIDLSTDLSHWLRLLDKAEKIYTGDSSIRSA